MIFLLAMSSVAAAPPPLSPKWAPTFETSQPNSGLERLMKIDDSNSAGLRGVPRGPAAAPPPNNAAARELDDGTGGAFGAWFTDEYGLPAYRFTADQTVRG
jgi:hypothetical protein